jgi:hypothetical protein
VPSWRSEREILLHDDGRESKEFSCISEICVCGVCISITVEEGLLMLHDDDDSGI